MLTYKEFVNRVVIEGLEQLQSRLGSNEGGQYYDSKTGKQHYIKFPKNPDQAKTEVLAGKIQHLMGIHTLQPQHQIINGRHAVVTDWIDDLTPVKHSDLNNLTPEHHHALGKMLAAGVLTKNWDTIGTGLDYDAGNIHLHSSGKLYNIDPGGSFNFRAQGGHKDYTPDINEKNTLRNPSMNYESANVFNTVFKKTPEALQTAVQSVKDLDDHAVHKAFQESGLDNWEELHKTFLQRKQQLIDQGL